MGAPSFFAVFLVLAAAFLHAFWNALIKRSDDRALSMGLVNLGHGLLGIIMALVFLPPAVASWPFIAASTVIHFFYYGFLLLSYRHGDLSEVYPIARGSAPVLVALGGLIFANEALALFAWMGIALVSGGIFLLFLARSRKTPSPVALYSAIVTGFTIAAYSIVDGLGVRISENPFGYIGWLFVLESISAFFLFYWRRGALSSMGRKFFATGVLGGVLSATAYGLAIYAASLTTLAAVSAIRESSVIIAALIGVVWFGERPWRIRMVAAMIVAAGVMLLATAK